MRRLRHCAVFVALLAAALLAGVCAAYPLYLAAAPFAALPFETAALHAVAASGVIAAALYVRAAGPWNAIDIGLRFPRGWRAQLAAAFAIGIGLIAALELVLVPLGVHRLDVQQDLGAGALLRRVSYALSAGLVIAVVEETLFRGVLYEGVRRRLGPGAAVGLSSAVYAAAHFIKFTPPRPGMEIGWWAAFELLPRALRRFADTSVYDSIAAVFLLGVLLGLLRRRFGHLAPGIGLHAGVAASLLVVKYLTDFAPDSRYAFLVSRYDNYQGGLACVWLAGAIAAFLVATRGAAAQAAAS